LTSNSKALKNKACRNIFKTRVPINLIWWTRAVELHKINMLATQAAGVQRSGEACASTQREAAARSPNVRNMTTTAEWRWMTDVHTYAVRFQCPKCGHELEQAIGKLKLGRHMPLSGCGVEINIDTRQLAGAAEKIRRSVEKVPPESPSNSSASAEPQGRVQNSPDMPGSTSEITGAKMDQEPRLALKIRLDQAKKMYAWSLYRTDISDPIKFSVPIFPTEAAATIAGMAVLTRVSEPRRPLGTRR
jgi:predicted RNA-binding Zn-ribbon protein involved in translation (DUF1610 family)